MKDKAIIMKKEIQAVVNYRALILSKNYISLLLILTTFYLAYFRYAMSPLYVFLPLNLLPPILTAAFKDYAKNNKNRLMITITQDTPFILSTMKKKYKYTKISHYTNSFSYLIALILLILWQYNYMNSENIDPLIESFPSIVLISGFSLRLLAILYFRIKIPYDISHNRI